MVLQNQRRIDDQRERGKLGLMSSASPANSAPRFSLAQLLYAVSVIAASCVMFPAVEALLLAVAILLVAYLFSVARRVTRAEWAVAVAIILCVAALIAPSSSPGPRFGGIQHFRAIAQALRKYVDTHGALPPAVTRDAEGRPAHSWRVLILPELEYLGLYGRYRWDEPWDGPWNRTLWSEMPREYGQLRGETETRVHAIRGELTAWPSSGARTADELRERAMPPWLIVEIDERPIPWMSPGDLDEDEALAALAVEPSYPAGHWRKGWFGSTWIGRRVAALTPAQSVEVFYSSDRSEAGLRQRLRGESAEFPDHPTPKDVSSRLPGSTDSITVIHWARLWRGLVFLIIVFWPVLFRSGRTQADRGESHAT